MHVGQVEPGDRARVDAFLEGHGARAVARGGELVDASLYPALIAQEDGKIVGVLTYIPAGHAWEVLTLHAEPRRNGSGTALMHAVEGEARKAGARELILTTTNDNLDALRFYQRRGFDLVGIDPGAVDRARKDLKPQIPRVGEFGIPIRDELRLRKVLVQ